MVRLGVEAQVGFEGGVQASFWVKFGGVLWVAASGIFGGWSDGLLLKKWVSWRVISGCFGSWIGGL